MPRWDAARQDASEALQLSPAHPGGLLAMARAEAGEGGNTTASIQYYETYVRGGGGIFHAFFICFLLYRSYYIHATCTTHIYMKLLIRMLAATVSDLNMNAPSPANKRALHTLL